MTAKQYAPGATHNREGNGRGMKSVTKPLTKKRGASKERTKLIDTNRKQYTSISNVPTHLIAETYDPDKPLTEKAKLFIKYWAQGESVASASARAGYGDGATYAYKITRTPQAIAMYQAEKALYEEAGQITRKKVMDMHMEAYEMAKLMAEPATMVSAARELGRMAGYYEPIKVSMKVTGAAGMQLDRMNKLTDAELLELIAQGGAQAIENAVRSHEAEENGEPE